MPCRRIADTARRSLFVHGKNLSVGNVTIHELARPDKSHESLFRSRLSAICRMLTRPLPERRDIFFVGGEVLPVFPDELENVGQRSVRLLSQHMNGALPPEALLGAKFQIAIHENGQPVDADLVQVSETAYSFHIAQRAASVLFEIFEGVTVVDRDVSEFFVLSDFFHIDGMGQLVVGTFIGAAEVCDEFFGYLLYLCFRCLNHIVVFFG